MTIDQKVSKLIYSFNPSILSSFRRSPRKLTEVASGSSGVIKELSQSEIRENECSRFVIDNSKELTPEHILEIISAQTNHAKVFTNKSACIIAGQFLRSRSRDEQKDTKQISEEDFFKIFDFFEDKESKAMLFRYYADIDFSKIDPSRTSQILETARSISSSEHFGSSFGKKELYALACSFTESDGFLKKIVKSLESEESMAEFKEVFIENFKKVHLETIDFELKELLIAKLRNLITTEDAKKILDCYNSIFSYNRNFIISLFYNIDDIGKTRDFFAAHRRVIEKELTNCRSYELLFKSQEIAQRLGLAGPAP